MRLIAFHPLQATQSDLAQSLAQNRPNIVIAVIEAGDYHENDPLVDIPGMCMLKGVILVVNRVQE